MTVLIEGNHRAEFLVSEANGTRSREIVTVLSATALEPGTVLALQDDSYYVPLDEDATSSDLSMAAAILYDHVDADSSDGLPAVAITNDAEVNGHELIWPAGISAEDKTAAETQLRAAGIKVRY